MHTELILAGLLFAIAALVTLARVLNVPYPIFLVLGGLAIGLVPGMPHVELEPELVLLTRCSTRRRSSPPCATCARTSRRSRRCRSASC
jgi:hypothetical protein